MVGGEGRTHQSSPGAGLLPATAMAAATCSLFDSHPCESIMVVVMMMVGGETGKK